jgi:hypothetical protein
VPRRWPGDWATEVDLSSPSAKADCSGCRAYRRH